MWATADLILIYMLMCAIYSQACMYIYMITYSQLDCQGAICQDLYKKYGIYSIILFSPGSQAKLHLSPP